MGLENFRIHIIINSEYVYKVLVKLVWCKWNDCYQALTQEGKLKNLCKNYYFRSFVKMQYNTMNRNKNRNSTVIKDILRKLNLNYLESRMITKTIWINKSFCWNSLAKTEKSNYNIKNIYNTTCFIYLILSMAINFA